MIPQSRPQLQPRAVKMDSDSPRSEIQDLRHLGGRSLLGLLELEHGALKRCEVVERPLARGLDTGCVWGKRLTAWIAEEDRIVHVPAARVYSPTSLPD